MNQVMIFDGVLSGCMYSNTRYVVYNVWKASFCVAGMCTPDNR